MCYMNINEFFESLAGKILTAPLQKQTVSYFMCDLLAYTPSKKLFISTVQPLVVQVFFLWAVFYWELRIGPLFLLTTNRLKHARQWEKMKWRKNKEASQCKAANIKKWFTVAANFSRWWVNVNGTWQSNFLQNTLWMQKGGEEKRLKRHKRIGELRRKHTERKGEQNEPYSSNMFLPAVTLVPIQV